MGLGCKASGCHILGLELRVCRDIAAFVILIGADIVADLLFLLSPSLMLKPVLPLTKLMISEMGKRSAATGSAILWRFLILFSSFFCRSGVTGSDFRLLGLKSLRICSIILLASRLSFANALHFFEPFRIVSF